MKKKIYVALEYLPIILSTVFSLLLFAFLAASMAVIPSSDFMGDKIDGMALFSGYDAAFKGASSELQGVARALFSFGIIGSAVSAVRALFAVRRKEFVYIKKRYISVSGIFDGISFVLYIIAVIISGSGMGIISSLDGGMGLMGSGACLGLTMAFAVIFLVLAAASIVARRVMSKKCLQLGTEIASEKAAKEQAELARREKFYAEYTAPQEPPSGSGVLAMTRYKHQKRRYDKAKEGAPSEVLVRLDAYKVRLIVIAVILTIAVMVISIPISLSMNIFRVGKVEKIELGFSQSNVEKRLGEPTEKQTEFWEYRDKDYAKILKKVRENEAAQEKAMLSGNAEKLTSLILAQTKLEDELGKLKHKYIRIGFSAGKVISVELDKTRVDGEPMKGKEVREVETDESGEVAYYCSDEIKGEDVIVSSNVNSRYCAYYTDGSFYRGTIKGGKVNIKDKKTVFVWSNAFAEHEKEIKAVRVGNVTIDGVWKSEGEIHRVTNLVLPNSVAIIVNYAFNGCSSLTSITFQGTKSQWNAIKKGSFWNSNTGNYTVHCTDGTISK